MKVPTAEAAAAAVAVENRPKPVASSTAPAHITRAKCSS